MAGNGGRAHGGYAVLILLAIAVAGCSNETTSRAFESAISSSTLSMSSTSAAAPQPRQPMRASTGTAAYDFGYNTAVEMGAASSWQCEELVNAQIVSVQRGSPEEFELLAMYQGCLDASAGRAAAFSSVRNLPPGGVPYEDPCLSGDIEPWVVIYDGPGGSGDISVGAPCQAVAEDYALSQLPPGSFVVESWRA